MQSELNRSLRPTGNCGQSLRRKNSASLRPVNDVPALNVPFKALVTDPRVTMFLLPVPSSVSKTAVAPTQVATGDAPKPAPPNRLNKKRKLTRAHKACPAELKDFNLRLSQGSTSGPICWGYNLKNGCSNQTSSQGGGLKCKRGFHACANCHKFGHSVVSCRAVKSKA